MRSSRRGVRPRLGAAVPGRRVQPDPPAGRQRLVLDRGRGARPPHARAHPARRLDRDPQPAQRRALAHRAARDPRARERVPRARRALHARHRVRAGRVRPADARRLARARHELPRARPGTGNDAERLQLDFVAHRARLAVDGPRAARGRRSSSAWMPGSPTRICTAISGRNQSRLAPRCAGAAAAKVSAAGSGGGARDRAAPGAALGRALPALESAASDKVALAAIEPDTTKGTVMISGDGKDYLAALSYVSNLSRDERLGARAARAPRAQGGRPARSGELRRLGGMEREMKRLREHARHQRPCRRRAARWRRSRSRASSSRR